MTMKFFGRALGGAAAVALLATPAWAHVVPGTHTHGYELALVGLAALSAVVIGWRRRSRRS
jgi:hypothetical protein